MARNHPVQTHSTYPDGPHIWGDVGFVPVHAQRRVLETDPDGVRNFGNSLDLVVAYGSWNVVVAAVGGFQSSLHGVGFDVIDIAAENSGSDAECSAVGCAHVFPGEVVGV